MYGSDTLWSVRHEWVRKTLVDNSTDELVWVEYARICYNRHSLDISYLLDECAEVIISHLC